MTAQSRATLYTYFESGDKPTQQQFADLIDSFQLFNTPTNSYYVDTGTASAYVITTSPVTTSYTDGMAFYIKFTHASTGNSTLNAGGGAVSITYMDGSGLSSGTIPTNGIGLVAYSSTSTAFQLLNIIPSTAGGAITALTGDVTASGTGSVAATIAANAVTNAKLNTMAANTVKVNATSGTAVPTDFALSASTILGRGSAGNIVGVTIGTGLAMSAGGVLSNSASSSTGITTIVRQSFTSNGTYTPTANMTYCIIEVIGGGGGGGGAKGGAAVTTAGGGGGAGKYQRLLATAAQIGASQAVTIGAAGTAGAATPTNGGDGGNTSVGTLCVGPGGSGGNSSSTTSPGNGGAGGNTGTGDLPITNVHAAYGGTGVGASIVTISPVGGYGAPSYFSGGIIGGKAAPASQASGFDADNNTGAGGSGGASGSTTGVAGGAGGSGFVIITEFCTS